MRSRHYGPQTTDVGMQGLPVTMEDLAIQGRFSSDRDTIEDLQISGLMDTRGLKSLVDKGAEDDAVCQLLAGFGLSCSACDDGVMVCIEIELDNLKAEAPGSPLAWQGGDCLPSCKDADGVCQTSSCGSVEPRGSIPLLLFGLALTGCTRRRGAAPE